MTNPNPNLEHRFKKGVSGNPGGKSSAQRKAEVKAAELAATIRLDLVKAVAKAINGASNEEVQLQIRSDVLNLLKQSEDRAFGTPKQTVESDVTTRTAPEGLDAFYAGGSGGADGDGE